MGNAVFQRIYLPAICDIYGIYVHGVAVDV